MEKTRVNDILFLCLWMMVISGGAKAQALKNDTTEGTSHAFVLEALMVTADRREEMALDVPSSIQTFDRSTIEKGLYENTDELIQAVPNANLTQQRAGAGEANLSIRGIGTTTINVDQTIGFYIDDIPVSSVSEFGLEYYDIERIEILRGPQGTLYGRNALGGVVHVKTAQPDAQQQVKINSSYGSDNEKRLSLIANTPILSDKIFGRFNFLHAARDARIENTTIGADDVDDMELNSGRGKILFLPSEQMELLLSADIEDTEKTIGTGFYDTATRDGVNQYRPVVFQKTNKGVSLEGLYEFERMKFVSLTSFRRHEHESTGSRPETTNYNPLIPETIFFNNDSNVALDQKTFTQEFRFESTDAQPLSWIAGLFFQYNDADRVGDLVNVSTNIYERSFANTEDRSIAAFSDFSYQVNQQFSLTAGVRVSHDKKRLDYDHVGSFAPLYGANFAPNQQLKQDVSFNDISPRFVVEYRFNPDHNVYLKAARGYKAGGFNTEFLAVNSSSYDKESIWSYEAGIKSRLLNGLMELDMNLFHMDWSDQQVLVFDNGMTRVTNAEESRSQGFEFQVRTRPIAELLLTTGIGYVDASFIDTPDSLMVNGNQQPNTSKWSAALSARYDKSIQADMTGFINADLSYKSSFYWDVENTTKEPSHVFLNLSGGIEGKNYELTLFAKNLLDEEYRVSFYPAVPGFFASQAQPGHGREVGIKAIVKF